MLINLLTSFKAHATSQTGDQQTSFAFNHPPRIVFVKNMEDLTPISHYDQLDGYNFSDDDQQKLNETINQIEKNGGYDGDQLLFEGLVYNDTNNTLYAIAKKAKYSFILTLKKSSEAGGFERSSLFYRKTFCTAGVRAPFITNDIDTETASYEGSHTFFMKRTKPPKVYSVAAGMLEPPQGILHPLSGHHDLVTYTAYNEAIEEFLGSPQFSDAPLREQLSQTLVPMVSCGLSAVAIRQANDSRRIEIEFIHPFHVKCSHEKMAKIVQSNNAKDAHEHDSTQYISIPLSALKRKEAEDRLAQISDEAKYVQDPIIAATSILACPSYSFFPRVLPGEKTTDFVPVSTLIGKVPRPISESKRPSEKSVARPSGSISCL